MSMPSWYYEMARIPGCDEFANRRMLKFAMGHTHCNSPHEHDEREVVTGFRVAGFGMAGCGNFGIPVLDTTEDSVRLFYFDTSDLPKYSKAIECIVKQGWRACTHLAEKWLDQPIVPNPRWITTTTGDP